MPRTPNILIRASAGTGKTFQLSNRYLTLLLQGVSPDAVLATTFTRKAAGEILERVVRRLAEAAGSDARAAELGRFLQLPGLTARKCRETLAPFVRKLHRVRIGTLDSVFAQIGRSFALELGLPPAWQIVDEVRDASLRAAAINGVLREEAPGDLLTLLNLLSKGETQRGVASLVADTVETLYSLFLDSDRDAWHRLPRPPSLAAAELDLAIERLASLPIAVAQQAKVRDSDVAHALAQDWQALLSKGLAAKVADGTRTYNRKPLPDDLVEAYEPLVRHAKGVLVGRIVMQTEATYALLEKFDRHYRRLQQEQGALRFDDVARSIARAERLGGATRLGHRLDAPLEHLLLDEFQDTSLVQWQVLRPLAQQAATAPGGSFFCVGDGKQAIYGWRGGVSEIFDAVERELPDIAPQTLAQSFRSAPAVIETVNRVFTQLATHPNLDNRAAAARDWSERFPLHSTAKATLPGYAALETAPAAGEGENQREVTLRYAAERVEQLFAATPGATFGVLVRSNEAVARLIYELRQRHLPASEEGGNPLVDSAGVLAVLSLLKLLDHPGDTIARFHVGHSPLGAAVGLTDPENGAQAAAVAHEGRRRLLQVGFGAAIEGWIEPLLPQCNARELRRLEQLVDLAYAYDPQATLRTSDFLRLVEATRQADATPDPIRVMTIHQAKGLEFDVVVLPELDGALGGQDPAYVVERPSPTEPITTVCRYAAKEVRALLPARIQTLFDAAMTTRVTGDLCLLYVALTRAVHALHMLVAPSRANERNVPKRVSALLRCALVGPAPLPEKQVVFEQGNRDWRRDRQVAGRFTAAPPPAAAAPEPVRATLAPPLAEPPRHWQASSPSKLVTPARRSLLAEFDPQRSGAAQRGTVLHAWFEELEWLDAGPPSEERLRQVAARLETHHVDLERLLQEFRDLLAGDAVGRVFDRARYQAAGLRLASRKKLPPWTACELEVYRERRLLVRDEARLLSGAIDRLVVWKQAGQAVAAEVLDFKTDKCPPGDAAALAALREKYLPQMAAYRRAAARQVRLPVDQVAVRLLVVQADALLDAAE